jgi:hypothetical protein
MTDTDANITLFDDEIRAARLLDVYRWRMENPTESLRAACIALKLPYDAVRKWIKEGTLHDYLDQIRDFHSDLAQSRALEMLPEIVEYQFKLATGQQRQQGVNPTAAADFVLKIAQLGAGTEAQKPTNLTQINNVFIPQTAQAALEGGRLQPPSRVIDVD